MDLRYLTAVLNSKVVKYWLRNKGTMQGNQFQIDVGPLLGVPIVVSEERVQKKLAGLVDRMVAARMEEARAKTQAKRDRLERIVEQEDAHIQELVIKLYGLSDEDVPEDA